MLILHTALAAESKPLVQALKLKRVREHRAFACYSAGELALIESGPGRLNAAAAVGFVLGALDIRERTAMLNIGIAGSQNHALGTALLVDKVVDAQTGRCLYPSIVFTPPCPSSQLTTLEQADRYPEDGACDMEASAFFGVAYRALNAELIHSLKVISDTDATERDRLAANTASELVASVIPTALEVMESLHAVAAQLNPVEAHQAYLDQQCEAFYELSSFSESQRSQLRRLLSRHAALFRLDERSPETRILDTLVISERVPSARTLLDALARELTDKRATVGE